MRGFTTEPADAPFGTLTIRRRFTNNTGTEVTRLRFRVTIITGHPNADPSHADLRVRTAADQEVSDVADPDTCAPGSHPCTVTVRGAVLESPSAVNNGGLNSSLRPRPWRRRPPWRLRRRRRARAATRPRRC